MSDKVLKFLPFVATVAIGSALGAHHVLRAHARLDALTRERDAYRNLATQMGTRIGLVMAEVQTLGGSNGVVYLLFERGKSQCLAVISNNVAHIYPNVGGAITIEPTEDSSEL